MGEQPLCPPFSKAGDTCLHNPSLLPYLSCGGGGGGDWRRTQSRNAEHCWLKGCMQNQAELSGSGSLSPGVGSHAFCQTIKKKKKSVRIKDSGPQRKGTVLQKHWQKLNCNQGLKRQHRYPLPQHTTLKAQSPRKHHGFCSWNPRWLDQECFIVKAIQQRA